MCREATERLKQGNLGFGRKVCPRSEQSLSLSLTAPCSSQNTFLKLSSTTSEELGTYLPPAIEGLRLRQEDCQEYAGVHSESQVILSYRDSVSINQKTQKQKKTMRLDSTSLVLFCPPTHCFSDVPRSHTN